MPLTPRSSAALAALSLLPDARSIAELSRRTWGDRGTVLLLGSHDRLERTLLRVRRMASADAPVLVLGETGTGKELLARALYLLSPRAGRPFLAVNCAQYADGQLLASELFGHRRGAFTGAHTDHRGVFEEANGGVVFLDEVGELLPTAQAMLLRVLGEGELVPVGETRARRVDVRVVAATSRDLPSLVAAGRFRLDLYHRLRQLPLHVPALRERGDDWREILAARLGELEAEHRHTRRFAPAALRALEQHSWPGNVRELRGVVDTGFHLSTGSTIEVDDIVDALDHPVRSTPAPEERVRFSALVDGEGSFWDLVYRPFMARELNRAEVRAVIRDGLEATRGSYKRLLPLFRMNANEYLRFMDFLRHHDLKPAAPATDEMGGAPGHARSSSIA